MVIYIPYSKCCPNFYLLLSISCIYLVQRSERSLRSTKRRQEERTIQRIWSRWNRQRTHSPSTGIFHISIPYIPLYPFIAALLSLSLPFSLSLFIYSSKRCPPKICLQVCLGRTSFRGQTINSNKTYAGSSTMHSLEMDSLPTIAPI